MITPSSRPISNFYPRPLRGGRLLGVVHVRAQIGISIHALCEEGDRWKRSKECAVNLFLSTPSARRATAIAQTDTADGVISIHALCEEGDSMGSGDLPNALNFYPRPLRGGRQAISLFFIRPVYFYPRPLRGGRQLLLFTPFFFIWNFYPRPLRGGRPESGGTVGTVAQFLSTPSARRATRAPGQKSRRFLIFLSTPSARRATCHQLQK